MPRFPLLLPAIGASFAALVATSPARADASAWMSMSGGATSWKSGSSDASVNGTLSFDVGVGTTPDAPYIVGGLFRLAPIFTGGSDVALLARVATQGFQAGRFGLALEAGGYARPWGVTSTGFAGGVTLGAPLGLQLSVQTLVGNNDSFALGAVAGIDFLRLTVYRQSLLEWWPNPSPAQESAPSPEARRRAGLGGWF